METWHYTGGRRTHTNNIHNSVVGDLLCVYNFTSTYAEIWLMVLDKNRIRQFLIGIVRGCQPEKSIAGSEIYCYVVSQSHSRPMSTMCVLVKTNFKL